MEVTLVENLVDAAGDFVLVLVSAILSPVLLVLDILNLVDFEVSFGGGS